MDKCLKFSDLDNLIEFWVSDLNEMSKVFTNQAQEINKYFFKIGENHNKVQLLNDQVTVLKCNQLLLDQSLNVIEQRNCQIENFLNQYEPKVVVYTDLKAVDPERGAICSDFDKVVSHLNNLKTEVEDLKDSWDAFDECSLKSPFHQLTRIITLHLEQLESIELKLYQLTDLINQVEMVKHTLGLTKII